MPALTSPDAPPAIVQQQGATADPAARYHTPGDPLERTNRHLYGFNTFLDRHALRPLAMIYKRWLPRPIRHGVHNILSNLAEPNIFLNDVLQLRPLSAARSGGRFLLNSTIGVLGVFDVAGDIGILDHDNDFGLTLGRYGVGAGPYLYLPIVGPSSLRDAAGAIVDFAIDPIPPSGVHDQDTFTITQSTLDALDTRADIDQSLRTLNQTSIDPYASVRSIYQQYRTAALNHGHALLEDMPAMPDEEPGAATTSSGAGAQP